MTIEYEFMNNWRGTLEISLIIWGLLVKVKKYENLSVLERLKSEQV